MTALTPQLVVFTTGERPDQIALVEGATALVCR